MTQVEQSDCQHYLATAANEAGDIVTVEAAARSAFSRFVELVLDDAPGGRYTFEAGLAANTLRDLLIQTNRKLEALPIAVKAAEFFAAAARARLDNAGYQDPAASAQRRLEWLARELGRNQVAEAAERGARDVEEIAAALRKLPRIDEVLTRIRPLIERRDWKRAAEELDKGLGQRPLVEPSVCYRIALIRLLADDAAGYAKVIESMSRRLLSNEWPHEIGRTLTIHPRGAGNDPEALIVLVREAEQFSRPQDADWYLLNLGLAHYRAGRYEQALAHLKEAPGREGYRVLWPALAMVEHKLGHPEEARRWLDKAHAHFKEIIDGGPEALKEDMKVFWEDWAYFEVMLREADALIAGEPPRS